MRPARYHARNGVSWSGNGRGDWPVFLPKKRKELRAPKEVARKAGPSRNGRLEIMKKTPLALVKERFKSKLELVAAVEKLTTDELWVDVLNTGKGLKRVSNAKLVRLNDRLSQVKKEFGSRAKLVAAILELEKRTKDDGYKSRLNGFAVPRLLDLHAAVKRRVKQAS